MWRFLHDLVKFYCFVLACSGPMITSDYASCTLSVSNVKPLNFNISPCFLLFNVQHQLTLDTSIIKNIRAFPMNVFKHFSKTLQTWYTNGKKLLKVEIFDVMLIQIIFIYENLQCSWIFLFSNIEDLSIFRVRIVGVIFFDFEVP